MEKFYNIKNTADALGLKVRTVRQWIRDGKIKAQKYPSSNRWYITEEEIGRIQNGHKD